MAKKLVLEYLKAKKKVSVDEVASFLFSQGVKESAGYYAISALQALYIAGDVELEITEDGSQIWKLKKGEDEKVKNSRTNKPFSPSIYRVIP